MKIEIFTDGSATTKDKPGGWAYVLVRDGNKTHEGSGGLAQATNNDAEMEAAIQGLLAAFKEIQRLRQLFCYGGASDEQIDRLVKPEVILCSDSQIILNWANGHFRFKQESKKQKYEQLRGLMKKLQAHTLWVEGHAGHEHNERCDELAGIERSKLMGTIAKKKSAKSTLMLRVIKELAKLAEFNIQNSDPQWKSDWHIVKDRCDEVLGK